MVWWWLRWCAGKGDRNLRIGHPAITSQLNHSLNSSPPFRLIYLKAILCSYIFTTEGKQNTSIAGVWWYSNLMENDFVLDDDKFTEMELFKTPSRYKGVHWSPDNSYHPAFWIFWILRVFNGNHLYLDREQMLQYERYFLTYIEMASSKAKTETACKPYHN